MRGNLIIWATITGLWLIVPLDSAAQTIRYVPDEHAPIAFDPETGGYKEGASFDPLVCSEWACIELLHNIFEPLVEANVDHEIIPVLAKEWEKLDSLTYRFVLRDGVTFHNGEPFNAQAVKFSLERTSDVYGTTAWFPEISQIKIINSHAVDVVLKHEDNLFLHSLSSLGLMMPPRHIRRMGARRFGNAPVGTGAFRFVDWDSERREVHMAAHEGYWRDGYPKVDTLVYSYMDSESAFDMLVRQDVDLVRRMNPRRTTEFMTTGAGRVVKEWLPQLVSGGMNALKPDSPLRDRRVREAINIAINREHLIRYGTIGNARLLGAYSLPGDPAGADLPPLTFNPGKSRMLLAEAGYADGLSLHVVVLSSTPFRLENIISASLRNVGIDLTIGRAGPAEYLEQVFLSRFDDSMEHSVDLFVGGIPLGMMNHPGMTPMVFLYSGEINQSVIQDDKVDELYDRAISTQDPEEALVLWQELERYSYENHFMLFGYQERAVYGAVNGLQFTPRVMMRFWDAYYDDD